MKGWIFRSALLALVAVVAGGAFAAAAQAAPQRAVGGSVDWGVKFTFRNYIKNAPPPGTITTNGQATENPDGTYNFPVRSGYGDAEDGKLVVDLAGGVTFLKPAHGIDIHMSQLRLELSAGAGTLYGHLQGHEEGELVDLGVVPVATLDPTEITPDLSDGILWPDVPSVVSAAGGTIFHYDPETEFDPLSAQVELGEGPVEPSVKPRARAGLKGSRATVAKLNCGYGPCLVQAPKRAKLRIGRKSFNAQVKAPARVGTDKQAQLRVKLNRRVKKKLARRTGKLTLQVTLSAPGDELSASAKVTTTLVGGKR